MSSYNGTCLKVLIAMGILACCHGASFKNWKKLIHKRQEAACHDYRGWDVEVGETFYIEQCIRCTCHGAGHFGCVGPPLCPQLSCDEPVQEPDDCCPRCPSEKRSSVLELHSKSDTCHFEGVDYPPGPMETGDPCLTCTCEAPYYYCSSPACSMPACPPGSSAVMDDEHCCPYCS